jgi:hypothetical protein
MKDMIIKCQSCNQYFSWAKEEQEFYAEKGLKPPKYCPICRSALKAAKKDQFRGKLKISQDKNKDDN